MNLLHLDDKDVESVDLFDDEDNLTDDDDLDDEEEEMIPLRIKASSPHGGGGNHNNTSSRHPTDVTVSVAKSWTVAAAKQAVRDALAVEHTRYVRLICHGRLWTPDAARVADCCPQLAPHLVVHAVVAAPGQQGGAQAVLQQQQQQQRGAHNNVAPRRNMMRGTGLNEFGMATRHSRARTLDSSDNDSSDEHDDDEENARRRPAAGERLGFDGLRDAPYHLHRHQVLALRTYFSRHIDRWLRQNALPDSVMQEPDAIVRRRRVEDVWMQNQGPTSEFRLNLTTTTAILGGTNNNSPMLNSTMLWRANNSASSVGNDRDFVWGFLLGFFVGAFMLAWVWFPTVPHKQKLGILTGISFQIALNMVQSNKNDDAMMDGGGSSTSSSSSSSSHSGALGTDDIAFYTP